MNKNFINSCSKNLNLNHSLKECSSFKKNTDQRYKKVIDHVRNMNSIVIHDVSISGEGIYGIYSIYSELIFLRLIIHLLTRRANPFDIERSIIPPPLFPTSDTCNRYSHLSR